MVEFLIGKKLLTDLFRCACVMKTNKGKRLIDTLEITVQDNEITARGIDVAYTVMSYVRARVDEVIEPGTFVYSPAQLLGRLQSFGSELSVKTDNEKIYVTDLENVTTFIDTLPETEIRFPRIEFEEKQGVLVPKSEKIESLCITEVVMDLPKFERDVVLHFGANGFEIMLEDELTTFKKKLGTEKFEQELKVKVNGNYLDKIISVIKTPFVLGANENIVYIYANLSWGEVAYLVAPMVME